MLAVLQIFREQPIATAILVLSTVDAARLLNSDFAGAIGVWSGATTNTPSLGAAQQALDTLAGFPADRASMPALAFAVAYPAGIVGIIASLVLLRALFRIDPACEAEQ